jgi:hypothetical protein
MYFLCREDDKEPYFHYICRVRRGAGLPAADRCVIGVQNDVFSKLYRMAILSRPLVDDPGLVCNIFSEAAASTVGRFSFFLGLRVTLSHLHKFTPIHPDILQIIYRS